MSSVIRFFEGDRKLGEHPLTDEQATAMAPLLAAVSSDPSLRSLFTGMLKQQLSAVSGSDPANPLLAALREGSAELRMEIGEAQDEEAAGDLASAGDLADGTELAVTDADEDSESSSSDDNSDESSSDASGDSDEERQEQARMIGEGGPV